MKYSTTRTHLEVMVKTGTDKPKLFRTPVLTFVENDPFKIELTDNEYIHKNKKFWSNNFFSNEKSQLDLTLLIYFEDPRRIYETALHKMYSKDFRMCFTKIIKNSFLKSPVIFRSLRTSKCGSVAYSEL